jgi:hypothetical protein
VTMNRRPPTVIEPMRDVRPVFAATSNETDPSPVPPASPVIVSHAADELAVQLQEAAAATAIVPLDDSAGALTELGEIIALQVPACVTVNVRPAIAIEAVRAEVAVLASTE